MTIKSLIRSQKKELERLLEFKKNTDLTPYDLQSINCEIKEIKEFLKVLDKYKFKTKKESKINNKN